MGRRAVADPAVLRGQIWLADVGLARPKRFLIFSNNDRNRRLRDVLGVRMTTADKPSIPSIAAFGSGEVSESRTFAVGDDIVPLPKEALVRRVGGLSIGQMRKVEEAVKAALALS